jgi:uncharacterized repeat protein (TIGR04076 family)
MALEEEMAERYSLRITVLRKLSAIDVFGKLLPEVAETLAVTCDRLQEGQVFVVDKSGAMPAGFCTWAWHDIYPVVIGLRYGASYPWMMKEGLIYSCCSDGARPVFFKIERT